MMSNLLDVIRSTFAEVYRSQLEGKEPPELMETTVLLETGLDSLGFAVLVTTLEERLGFDPFTIATEAYYPRTFGDFVSFYARHTPS